MNFIARIASGGTVIALVAFPTLAMAQSTPAITATPSKEPPPVGAGTPRAELPPPRSSDQPPPPAPAAPSIKNVKVAVTKEAGIGGTQSYARSGVLELGGAVGFGVTSNYTQLSIAPSVGWFFTDNFEISAIGAFSYVNSNNAASNTSFTILAEPSYHLPFSDYLFGFLGVGAGINTGNRGTGFALAPRLGLNILVGRSGILSPAVQLSYSTAESLSANGSDGAHTAFGANVGYTVMW